MKAVIGFASWWAQSIVATADHLAWRGLEEYRRRHPKPVADPEWNDGTN